MNLLVGIYKLNVINYLLYFGFRSMREQRVITEQRASLSPLRLSETGLRALNSVRAKAEAVIQPRTDFEGFVDLSFINRPEKAGFDRRALNQIAAVLFEVFSGYGPNVILGIGKSGTAQSQAVYEQWSNRNCPISHRLVEKIEGDEVDASLLPEDGSVIQAISYTGQNEANFWVPDFKDGARILIIDDVIAYGHVSIAVAEGVLKRNPKVTIVGLGASFSKEWQKGQEKFTKTTGIPSFSAIPILRVDGDRVVLTSEEDAASLMVSGNIIAQVETPHRFGASFTEDGQLFDRS